MKNMNKILVILTAVAGVFLGSYSLAGAVSTFVVQQGGTGQNTFSSAQLLYGAGINPIQSVATTSVTCSGSVSCTTFSAIGASPITITSSALTSAITSIGPTGQLQVGPAVTLATTSSTTNGITSNLTITGSGNTLTFLNSQSGVATVAGGGTGQSSFTASQLLYGNGTNALSSVGTSTLTAGTGLTGSFTQIGSGGTVALSVPVSIANGGTATTTGGNINGIEFYDGSKLTNLSNFTYNGTVLKIGTLGTPAGTFLAADPSGNVIATSSPSGGGSGTVTSVGLATPNSSLSLGGTNPVTTSGTINADLNLGHSNWWTALQNFTNASSSQLTATSSAYLATNAGYVLVGTTTPQTGVNSGTATSLLVVNNGQVMKSLPSRSFVSSILGMVGEQSGASSDVTAGIEGFGASGNIGSQPDGTIGVLAYDVGSVSGAADTNYALYANQSSAYTTTYQNYAVYALGGNNYFQNNTGIGSTSPFARLSVSTGSATTAISHLFDVASTTNKLLFGINAAGAIVATESLAATSTAITLDWATSPPQINYQIGTSATTITVINATTSAQAGSRKLIWICNPPSSSAGALTWTGVEWIGGTTPTQTTTAAQCDAWSFDITNATSTTAWKVAGSQGAGFQ